MATRRPQHKPVLWTLALLVAAAGWWYLSVYQERDEILTGLVTEEADMRRRNGESLETLTRLGPEELKNTLEAYERQISYVGTLLPVDTLTVEMLPYVTEAAGIYGVEIQGQRPVARHRQFGLVVDGITVTAHGTYHQVAAMMTSLLSIPRITHLRNVQLRAIPPRGMPADTPPITEVTFTLVTFSRGVPTALPVQAARPAVRRAPAQGTRPETNP